MSINKVVEVKDKYAPLEAERLDVDGKKEITHDDYPSIDKSADKVSQTEIENENYEGRKHQPEIDGPQQDSQETDEIYADPRDNTNLPPAGKNAGDLDAQDLGRDDI